MFYEYFVSQAISSPCGPVQPSTSSEALRAFVHLNFAEMAYFFGYTVFPSKMFKFAKKA